MDITQIFSRYGVKITAIICVTGFAVYIAHLGDRMTAGTLMGMLAGWAFKNGYDYTARKE